MLDQASVERDEAELSAAVSALSDPQRALFYAGVKPRLRDPDTYAALNWFFITGIHHFYLGRWVRGCIDLVGFLLGVVLILMGEWALGLLLILAISVIELWELFRSQIIIQLWNNQIYREELNKLAGKTTHH
ncbi:hypothetical protein ACFOSD_01795 [Salinispirillum marinum]|uniref:TM2 domain-containing protein n=2 Tax=Saccharospirillaceae TaxID=255527 RepID=A0ABV8BDH8_9GAMM